MQPTLRRHAGLLRMDRDLLDRVEPDTLHAYQRALQPFVDWLRGEQLQPEAAAEFDDLLIDFKVERVVSKSGFENLVAAVEYATDHEKPDKLRLPLDTDLIPHKLPKGIHGW